MKVQVIGVDEPANLYRVRLADGCCGACNQVCMPASLSQHLAVADGRESQGSPEYEILSSSGLWIKNTSANYSVGDLVQLNVSKSALIHASLIVFALPLACMVVFVGLASLLSATEHLLYTLGVMGIFAGTGISVIAGLRVDWSSHFDARLTSPLNQKEP